MIGYDLESMLEEMTSAYLGVVEGGGGVDCSVL